LQFQLRQFGTAHLEQRCAFMRRGTGLRLHQVAIGIARCCRAATLRLATGFLRVARFAKASRLATALLLRGVATAASG
jgi:hypothetical protein